MLFMPQLVVEASPEAMLPVPGQSPEMHASGSDDRYSTRHAALLAPLPPAARSRPVDELAGGIVELARQREGR